MPARHEQLHLAQSSGPSVCPCSLGTWTLLLSGGWLNVTLTLSECPVVCRLHPQGFSMFPLHENNGKHSLFLNLLGAVSKARANFPVTAGEVTSEHHSLFLPVWPSANNPQSSSIYKTLAGSFFQ